MATYAAALNATGIGTALQTSPWHVSLFSPTVQQSLGTRFRSVVEHKHELAGAVATQNDT